ncbi:hypothetical protein [Verrucomicrobium spinosum]|uniref:hypothetical protein n=1 Tax=Verrucomicrobium spinosum TaxID=2736 RepID=UPI0009463947|nr:hypothetical protein [Verrucomicrobium spinosum]
MVFLDVDSGGGCDKLVFTGTGSSDLSFTGTLTVGPTILTPTVERIFDLLDWSGLASTPSFGSQYTHTGLLYGNGDESPGLDLADVSGTGFAWDISNFTVDGTIALVAVPEPGRALLALLALACLAGRRVVRQAVNFRPPGLGLKQNEKPWMMDSSRAFCYWSFSERRLPPPAVKQAPFATHRVRLKRQPILVLA